MPCMNATRSEARSDRRKPARTHRRRLLPRGGPGNAGWNGNPLAFRFAVRRHFRPDLHFDQNTLMIAEPEAIALEAGGRIDELDTLPFDASLEPRQVLGVAAE